MSPKTMDAETRARAAAEGRAEQEILDLVDTLISGWNAHDAKVYASAFAEDADYVTVVGQWWRGQAENIKSHEAAFRGRFRRSRVKADRVSIRFIRPDVAVVHLQWEMTGDLGPDGNGIPLRRGIFTLVASRQQGNWRFDAAQNADLHPN